MSHMHLPASCRGFWWQVACGMWKVPVRSCGGLLGAGVGLGFMLTDWPPKCNTQDCADGQTSILVLKSKLLNKKENSSWERKILSKGPGA